MSPRWVPSARQGTHTCSPRDSGGAVASTRRSGNAAAQRRGVAVERVDAPQRVDRDRVLVGDVGGAAGLEARALPAGAPARGQLVEGAALELDAHRGSSSASPSSGEEACAYSRRGMRPACAGLVARLDRLAHGARHRDRVGGARDRAGQQHGVAAGLHRQRRVGGGADAGVEDHRHARALDDQAQVVGVVDAHAAADRRAERHHRRAAGVLEPARQDRVVVRVGQHHEAVARPASRRPRAARPGSGSSVRSSPITSSLTQSVPSASRASRAVVTASRAVKQPAVFGSTSSPASPSTSRIEPRALGSTRRIATVASSAPDSRAAAAIVSRLRKPPVPRISRERQRAAGDLERLGRAALHRVQHLDLLAVAQLACRPTRRAGSPRR